MISSAAIDILRNVTTGTITTILLKKGIRRSWMAGAMPFGISGKRVVGTAFTLRFVPVREDLATPESWSKPISTRSAIEAMPQNCVVVADAMGVTGILATFLYAQWSNAASPADHRRVMCASTASGRPVFRSGVRGRRVLLLVNR